MEDYIHGVVKSYPVHLLVDISVVVRIHHWPPLLLVDRWVQRQRVELVREPLAYLVIHGLELVRDNQVRVDDLLEDFGARVLVFVS